MTSNSFHQVRVALSFLLVFVAGFQMVQASALRPLGPRHSIPLNGTWQIGQGGMDAPPADFTHSIPVPGLADMASPAFTEVGKVSTQREAFWYRRSFRIDRAIPEIAILKLRKARYGAWVWINGELAGEHLPCFTPAEFDVRHHLREGENDILIRIGANREALPSSQPTGWDFEKYLFKPGIYDSVEIILTGAPFLRNVQTVPKVETKSVRVVAELVGGRNPSQFALRAGVLAAGSRASAGKRTIPIQLGAGEERTVDFEISLAEARLWSPEDPFLYELQLETGGDAARVRFGLRNFHFDPVSRLPILNGKPCFLRGSNITLYRFFEDADRGGLPWDEAWVRKLHRQMKAMNWNSLRYCIGFPPEFWYDIADEEGILIQDEFPVWVLNGKSNKCPEDLTAEALIPEYSAWMRERWNHPSVVIWDAQNESNTPETGKARDAVRHLDLSERPWDNGWGMPGRPTDTVESHPYFFSRIFNSGKPVPGKPFHLSEIAQASLRPRVRPAQVDLPNPIIINEYDWLWLNRDASPTNLTAPVYLSLLGPDSTVEQRRHLHARYVAALTEFWRCHRQVAGVMHFCSLGYSRDGSQPRPLGGSTSDDWIDLQGLRYEPHFAEYVKEAFAPVGLMLDFWADSLAAGHGSEMPVIAINDLEKTWTGQLRLRLLRGLEVISEEAQDCVINPFGERRLSFSFKAPGDPGAYTLEAALIRPDAPPTRSLRDFKVLPPTP
ncbi:MAG: hypothetical protein KBA71_10325 [Opitutaceae bacterium]|nr:hypothetical protein [Opitutaceae bacterium]